MRRIGIALVFVVALATIGWASGAWTAFKSAHGKFSVSLPSSPITMKIPLDVKGVKLELNMIAARDNAESFYTVAYCDLPADKVASSEPETILDRFVGGIQKNMKGDVLSNRSIMLKNIPGREFTVKKDDGKIALARVYYRNARIYQVMMLLETGKPVPADLDRFFESFRIL